MKLLLDTHAFIWWFEGDGRLRPTVRSALEDPESHVLFSSVSAFEMTTKRRIGKLGGIDDLLDDLTGYLERNAFEVLPVSLAHAELGGALPIPHRDPFDRLLIAQAQIEQAWLVSNETLFDQFGVRRLW